MEQGNILLGEHVDAFLSAASAEDGEGVLMQLFAGAQSESATDRLKSLNDFLEVVFNHVSGTRYADGINYADPGEDLRAHNKNVRAAMQHSGFFKNSPVLPAVERVSETLIQKLSFPEPTVNL